MHRDQKLKQQPSKLKPKFSGEQDTNSLTCLKCDKVFSTKQGLDRHVKSHMGTFKFWCDVCKVGYQNKTNYDLHNIKHTGLYPYNCFTCQKGFPEKRAFIEHENKHAGVKFSCRHCGRDYYLETKRDSHEKTCSKL